MTVGEKIRFLRTQKGLTQKELAAKSGIAEITIRQYEAGKYNPKPNAVMSLCVGLNCKTTDIIDDEEKKYYRIFDNIQIDTDIDENHPFNVIQKKIDNREQLTPEELTQYKEHISKALPSIRQALETSGESLKKSFSQYYALLNDEGQKEADIQIQRAIERVTEQAENQIKLLTRIPEYQKKPDD